MSGFQGVPPQQPQGPQPPFGMRPNPAYAQWQQMAQQFQAIQQENAKRTQAFQDAVALIKKDGIHTFRLDIEADSTIAPDEQAEKAARIEFMQQFVPLMGEVIPLAQGNAPLASLAKEITLFAVRGFPAARSVEEAIEKAFDQIAQMPPNPQQQKGGTQQNPQVEMAKVQADTQDTAVKARTDMMAIAQKQQQAQLTAQVAAEKTAAENQRSQADMALKAAEIAQRERLENARISHMAARDAGGLV